MHMLCNDTQRCFVLRGKRIIRTLGARFSLWSCYKFPLSMPEAADQFLKITKSFLTNYPREIQEDIDLENKKITKIHETGYESRFLNERHQNPCTFPGEVGKPMFRKILQKEYYADMYMSPFMRGVSFYQPSFEIEKGQIMTITKIYTDDVIPPDYFARIGCWDYEDTDFSDDDEEEKRVLKQIEMKGGMEKLNDRMQWEMFTTKQIKVYRKNNFPNANPNYYGEHLFKPGEHCLSMVKWFKKRTKPGYLKDILQSDLVNEFDSCYYDSS